MILGAFSLSLNVKDIQASKWFYEKLGFSVFAGDIEMKYLIMKNGTTLIGLFEGMFEKNLLTFNPGWDSNAAKLEEFDDVRKIHSELKDKDINTEQEALSSPNGPGSFVVIDPDGNPILIDQHI